MNEPFEITYHGARCVVVWATQVYQRLDQAREHTLTQLITTNPIVVFDFAQTRVIGTRWLRLVQRLSINADDMGKEIAVVGLVEALLTKADIVAIKPDLHIYDSLEQVPGP